jgi:hypothetical protein
LRRLRRPQSLAELALPQRPGALPAQVRILGLDPGSQRTGYAVVETQAGRIAYIVSGAIRPAASRWPSVCRRFSPASSR